MTLTRADREFACERACTHIATEQVRRWIAAAETDAEAAVVAKQQCRWWGEWAGHHIEGQPNGIHVEREGREGLVTWRELADYVRHPERQLELFEP